MRRVDRVSKWLAALALLSWCAFAGAAQAEKRVALVIGNGAYTNAPRLPNPKNDAGDVSSALKRIGFETIVGLDLDKAGMEDATVRFARVARDADVALFYYSGHALQFAGVNYLMPVDAKLADEADLRRMARVDDIVSDVQQAKNLRILVLDSCRDNPLAEELRRSIGKTRSAGLSRGLAKIDAPQGMIVAYATQSGRTAEDGEGRNSPYTAAFLKHIEAQEEIGTVFRRVSAQVFEATKRSQLPELSLSLVGEYYLKGRPTAQPLANAESAVTAALVQPPAATRPENVLAKVRQRGELLCGTNGNLPGFSSVGGDGKYTGLDVDICRALAAAIFDDPGKVKFFPVSAKDRFVGLLAGQFDVLARNTTRTAMREMELGLRFGQINFYDGQAFMVRKSLNVKRVADLNGASVCVQAGSTTELNLADFFRTRKMELRLVPLDTWANLTAAYAAGRCDSLTTDRSSLYAERARLAAPDDHDVLPELISNEALAPAVRKGDDQWLAILGWVHSAMVNAEELGVSRDNVEDQLKSKDPAVRRLLGIEGAFGEHMGLTNDWAYRIIRHVGNYGESFERNVGKATPTKMDRGPNALVSQGGQQQSPPIR